MPDWVSAFFASIIKELRKEGHQVEQFFLPYHPNKQISRLLKIKIFVKLISILKGNFYPYKTLDYDHKDEQIGKELKKGNFDIGFHKLNFIIRENIFGSFRLGLLNDHWGYLPLLRGKSTIAYSLLLDVPVISTVHFINQGIDSGPIVGYQHAEYTNAGSADDVRSVLRKKCRKEWWLPLNMQATVLLPQKKIYKRPGSHFMKYIPG